MIQSLKHNLKGAESEIVHQQRIVRVEKLLRVERNGKGLVRLSHPFKHQRFESLNGKAGAGRQHELKNNKERMQ